MTWSDLWVFILVTVILGGGGSWLTGRAIASTWRPWWQVVAATAVLAAVVRFFHFSLFYGTLLSLPLYILDFAVCLVFGLLGYRIRRVGQMAGQYPWLYRRSALVKWVRKPAAPNDAWPESS